MPPLVSQFGRQKTSVLGTGGAVTYKDDYDSRPNSKVRRPTGITYQAKTGTRTQPIRSVQQPIRRNTTQQKSNLASNILQLTNALQLTKGRVGTPRREGKTINQRQIYQAPKRIMKQPATRHREPSDSYSDYYSYYSDSYPSDYFDDLETSRSVSQHGTNGSKDTSYAMLDDLIELIKESSMSSQYSRNKTEGKSRSRGKSGKSTDLSHARQQSKSSQFSKQTKSRNAFKTPSFTTNQYDELSDHDFDSVVHQSVSHSQNMIESEIVIPNVNANREPMNFIEHNRLMAAHPYNAANNSKKSTFNGAKASEKRVTQKGIASSTDTSKPYAHQSVQRLPMKEGHDGTKQYAAGTPDISMITGSAGSVNGPMISSAIAMSGGADLSSSAGPYPANNLSSSGSRLQPTKSSMQSQQASVPQQQKDLYSEQPSVEFRDKPVRKYTLLKDSERYRSMAHQQQLSHSALLMSAGSADRATTVQLQTEQIKTGSLAYTTPNKSNVSLTNQIPEDTPLPRYISTANDAFNLFRDKYRNLKQDKKMLEKEVAELQAALESERSDLTAARQQIKHLEATKDEMRREFRAILDEKEKIIYQLNTTVDQAHRIAIDRSILDRSSADGPDIKLSAHPPIDTEAIYREAYEQAKMELLKELRQDLSIEIENRRAKARPGNGDAGLALSNLITIQPKVGTLGMSASQGVVRTNVRESMKPLVSQISNESSDIDYLKKGKKPIVTSRSIHIQEQASFEDEEESDQHTKTVKNQQKPLSVVIPPTTPIAPMQNVNETVKPMKDLTVQALVVSERDQSAQSGASSPMNSSPTIYKDPLRSICLHSNVPVSNKIDCNGSAPIIAVEPEQKSVTSLDAIIAVQQEQQEQPDMRPSDSKYYKEQSYSKDVSISDRHNDIQQREQETDHNTTGAQDNSLLAATLNGAPLESPQAIVREQENNDVHNSIENLSVDMPEEEFLKEEPIIVEEIVENHELMDNEIEDEASIRTKEHDQEGPLSEPPIEFMIKPLPEPVTESLSTLVPGMTPPKNNRIQIPDIEQEKEQEQQANFNIAQPAEDTPQTEQVNILDASTLMSGVVPDISDILAENSVQNLSMLPTPSGVSFMPRTEEHTGSELALRDDGLGYMELTTAINEAIDESYYGNFIVIFMNMSEYPEGGETLCQLGVNLANCIYANASIELNAINQFELLTKELLSFVHDQSSVFWSMSYYTAKVLLAYFCAFGTDTLELITAIAPDFAVVLTEVSPDMGEGFANECHVLGALLSLIASLGVLCTEGDLASFIQASQTLLNLMKTDDCPIYLYPIPVTIIICIEVLLTNGYFLPLEADNDAKDEASILQENVTEVVSTTVIKLCRKYIHQIQAGDTDDFIPEQHELCNIACLMQATILLQREVRLKPELLENVQAVFEGVAQSTRALATVPGLSQYYEIVDSSKSQG